ncbi:hypothetical protein Cni_G11298 [Canna indica]|uniref:Uncharacterized protein n=1 Tax=Canna indica TaxID=4628 RepID=A0AAQ3Q9E0_9LILI|nr:hypothetical protein Cni_G11298 [Canna indica]
MLWRSSTDHAMPASPFLKTPLSVHREDETKNNAIVWGIFSLMHLKLQRTSKIFWVEPEEGTLNTSCMPRQIGVERIPALSTGLRELGAEKDQSFLLKQLYSFSLAHHKTIYLLIDHHSAFNINTQQIGKETTKDNQRVNFLLCTTKRSVYSNSFPSTPMERFLRKYDKECMKMMMLKHEETFRQQVHELHRLYRVQKLLMRDMKNNNKLKAQSLINCTQFNLLGDQKNDPDSCLPSHRNQEPRNRRRRVLNLELPADEYIERAEEELMLELEEGGDIELTLTIGNNWRKREEASFTSDSAASFSSSSTESGGLKLTGHGWDLQQMDDANISCESSAKNHFELEGAREKHPSWHLQYLSLKMA